MLFSLDAPIFPSLPLCGARMKVIFSRKPSLISPGRVLGSASTLMTLLSHDGYQLQRRLALPREKLLERSCASPCPSEAAVRPRAQQALSALVVNKPSDPGVTAGPGEGRDKWQHVSRGTYACYPLCWGPEYGCLGVERGMGGFWPCEGKGSPWVSRKVLGPLGQELCGPPQLL